MPTNKNILKKMKMTELRSMYRDLARRANYRIEQVGSKRKLSNVYTRKYDPMLYGNTVANIGTKKGMFALANRGNKENLIERIQVVERFLDNPYTDVKHVNDYVSDLLSRTNLKNEENLVKMFDLYREYGYDDYKDDSDKIIQIMSEMYNNGYDPEKLLMYLDSGEYETQLEHIQAMEDAWDTMKVNQRIMKDLPPEEVQNRVLKTLRRRR